MKIDAAILRLGAALVLVALAGCERKPGAFEEGRDRVLAEAMKNVERHGELCQMFIDEIARGDAAAAYERTATLYRAVVTLERFDKAVRAHAYLKAGGQYKAHRTVTRGSNVDVEGTLTTADGPMTAVLHLVKTKDGERITGFTIGGMPALPIAAP